MTTNCKVSIGGGDMAEQLRDFAQFNGHLQELFLVLSKVNDILCDIKL